MRVAFFSDTHGNLKDYFDKINFNGVDLIVFLGDNEIQDLELFHSLKLKKIGILWNHTPWEKNKIKIDIFKQYNILDISWKKFEFHGKTFFGIPGEMKYILCESIMNWQRLLFDNSNIEKEIKELYNKIDILKKENPNIILSHFPAFWIMDKPKDFAHRGLNFLKEYISNKSPNYVIHGHLHKNDTKKLNKTKVIQIYQYNILDI